MPTHFFTRIGILLVTLLFLISCATPKQPPLPSGNLRIGVAPYTNPQTMAELLAGYTPENATPVSDAVLQSLDTLFTNELAKGKQRTAVPAQEVKKVYSAYMGQADVPPQAALRTWAAVGRNCKVDIMIVPQVFFWQERTGSSYGTTVPAGVILDVFVIDVNSETLISRSHFEEIQSPLSENLLNAGKFIRRQGKWVSTSELAKEAMQQAIKELGL